MNQNFRKLAFGKLLAKITLISPRVKQGKSLTQLIQESIGEQPTDFKEKFLQMPPGPEREQFVLEEIKKRKPIDKSKLVPVTVEGPGGTKITYKVLPDFITIDGIRVPMSGQTAQKVADHFGMMLPTAKQTEQIWQAANVRMRPPPLSAGGRIGNKYYSGEEVVRSKISDPDAAVAYSEMIEEELRRRREKGEAGPLVAGHMKNIIMPESDEDKLGLYGWFGEEGEPLEPSKITGHDTSVHTEYGAGARPIASDVTITLPNGKQVTAPMNQLLAHPEFSKYISNRPGVRKYRYKN